MSACGKLFCYCDYLRKIFKLSDQSRNMAAIVVVVVVVVVT